MKSEQRQKARELRSQGLSIREITKQLGVSQSSVSIWVRDIELSSEQIKNLELQNPIINRQMTGAKKKAEIARIQRLEYQQNGKNRAKIKNHLHISGCMLYWAEGDKRKNVCGFTNSDVNMLKFFKTFLCKEFNLKNDDFTITINYYTTNGLSKEDIENYWLTELQLDKSSLRKGQENNRPRSATNTVRHNKLPYGICRLIVKKSTYIIQHIYGAIQEYTNNHNNYGLN